MFGNAIKTSKLPQPLSKAVCFYCQATLTGPREDPDKCQFCEPEEQIEDLDYPDEYDFP